MDDAFWWIAKKVVQVWLANMRWDEQVVLLESIDGLNAEIGLAVS